MECDSYSIDVDEHPVRVCRIGDTCVAVIREVGSDGCSGVLWRVSMMFPDGIHGIGRKWPARGKVRICTDGIGEIYWRKPGRDIWNAQGVVVKTEYFKVNAFGDEVRIATYDEWNMCTPRGLIFQDWEVEQALRDALASGERRRRLEKGVPFLAAATLSGIVPAGRANGG